MDDQQGFGLVQKFYIDNGELAGLSPQQIFVLGWEFCNIQRLLDSGNSFELMFHSDNEMRVRKMVEGRGVTFSIAVHDDWPVLSVQSRG